MGHRAGEEEIKNRVQGFRGPRVRGKRRAFRIAILEFRKQGKHLDSRVRG